MAAATDKGTSTPATPRARTRASLRTQIALACGAGAALVGAGATLAPRLGLAEGGTLGVVAVGVSIAALVGAGLGRRIVMRIEALERAATKLRNSENLHELRSDGDELDELGAELSELARNLESTESELRSEQALSTRILSGMQEGVLLLDEDRRVVLMNPALREMLLFRADVVGKPVIEALRHAELVQIIDSAKEASASTGEIELSGMKPRRLLVRALRLAGGADKAQDTGGLLCVFVDVTEVRRLESLRRDFVANVSHELRTPVTGVLSGAETLRLAMKKDPDAAMRFVDIIERNADRLRRLIEDLLDLSRIESRELRLTRERLRFRAFADHVFSLFRDRADKRGMQLVVDCDGDLSLFVDRRALEQVIANLVDNAVKYARDKATITLSAHPAEAGMVEVTVADDGPGIDPVHLPRLFERFYRVDPGRARDQGGTGLGLAIAKHLTEALGGVIKVESAIGKGTRFAMTYPATDTTPPPKRDLDA